MRITILLLFVHLIAGAQVLELRRGDEVFQIKPKDEITVFSEQKGKLHDSLEVMARGLMTDFRQDTVYLMADEYVRHDYYRKGTDTLHYIDDILDSAVVVKIAAGDITGIFSHRQKLTRAMTRLVYVTLGTSLATLPFVLILDPGQPRDIISAVNIASTVTMLAGATTGIALAKRKFWIQPGYKKSWVIKR